MAARLNHTKNTLYFLVHFMLMAGIAGASIIFVGPWISLAVGVCAVWYTVNQYRDHASFVSRHMSRHSEAHEDSPNLRRLVAEVCSAAGINPDTVPVHDFNTSLPFEQLSKKDQRIAGAYYFMGRTHNAATADAAGDVLMVSAPLLKLLDDGEEKAVYAHEVAHIALRHVMMGKILVMMRRFITYTNVTMIYYSVLLAGWAGATAGLSSVFLCWLVVAKLHHGGEKFMARSNSGLTPYEIANKARAYRLFNFLLYTISVPVFTFFYPPFLKIALMTYVLPLCGGYVQARASRSREYQADAGAVKLGAGPLAMVTALRKMYLLEDRANATFMGVPAPAPSEQGLGNRFVTWYRRLFSTHPQGPKRIAALCAIARKRGVAEEHIEKARTGDITLSNAHDIPQDVIRYYLHAL